MKKYNYTTKTLNLNRDNEEDLRILEYLNTKRKVSDYLRELVLMDMQKENYISKETHVIEEKKEEPKDNGIDILGFDN